MKFDADERKDAEMRAYLDDLYSHLHVAQLFRFVCGLSESALARIIFKKMAAMSILDANAH